MRIARDEGREILEDLAAECRGRAADRAAVRGGPPIRRRAARGRRLAPRWAIELAAAGCSARASMRTAAGATLAKFCTAPAVSGGHSKECSCTLRPGGELRAKFRGRQVQLRGIENRPMTVVAQLLVPFHDSVPQTVDARCWPRACRSRRSLAAGTRTDARCARRTAAGRTRGRPAPALRSRRGRPPARTGRRRSAGGSGGGIRAPRRD